jgi:cystathionine gamma-synthase
MSGPRPKPSTLAAQAMGWIDPTTKAVIPPIHTATTFIRDPDNAYRAGHSYARDENPTYAHAEALLTELEGGAACRTFASGMAAATTVFHSLVPGDHVVVPEVMYWGLRKWLISFGRQSGLTVDLVDTTDLDGLAAAVRPGSTKLVWIETPANPT